MKNVIALVALLGLCFFSSCSNPSNVTLDPAGVYQGDVFLYNADQVIKSAFDKFQAFVSYEYNNRVALEASEPNVKKAADYIRAGAPSWKTSAIKLRDAYAANPTVENRKSLESILTVIQVAVNEASKYLIETSVPKTK